MENRDNVCNKISNKFGNTLGMIGGKKLNDEIRKINKKVDKEVLGQLAEKERCNLYGKQG